MTEEEKLIEDQLSKLPDNLRQVIKTTQWGNCVREVSILNQLSTEQTAALEKEVMFVLYGFENPLNLVGNLIRELEIGPEAAENIAEYIGEKIFQPISQEVEKLDSAKGTEYDPVIITQQNKDEALRKLEDREKYMSQDRAIYNSLPSNAPSNLPVIEEDEIAHEVPHIETETAETIKSAESLVTKVKPEPETSKVKPVLVETPRYAGGSDPYREPLQ